MKATLSSPVKTETCRSLAFLVMCSRSYLSALEGNKEICKAFHKNILLISSEYSEQGYCKL